MAKKVRAVRKRKDRPPYELRATLTSKGQLTLPVELRRLYDLKAGDELAFRVAEDALRVTPVRRRPASSFLGALPATRPYPGDKAMKHVITTEKVRHYRKKLGPAAPKR